VKSTETQRRLFKLPDLAYSVVPHPIVSMSEEELRVSADAIFDEIAAAVSRTRAAAPAGNPQDLS
jgi:hypothetical protein